MDSNGLPRKRGKKENRDLEFTGIKTGALLDFGPIRR
jgi:hypothetical protein